MLCAVLSRSVMCDSCDLMDCSPPGSSVHGDSPGKNTGVSCHAFLQGIFPTQGLNPGLLHCRQILYQLSHQGNPWILEWVANHFSRGSSWPRNWTRVSTAGGFFTSWATREAHVRCIYVNKSYILVLCSYIMPFFVSYYTLCFKVYLRVLVPLFFCHICMNYLFPSPHFQSVCIFSSEWVSSK